MRVRLTGTRQHLTKHPMYEVSDFCSTHATNRYQNRVEVKGLFQFDEVKGLFQFEVNVYFSYYIL